MKVLCAIYANIGGLAKAMVRDGVIDDALQMEEFVRGFNQSNGPFDFIDVGYGKERADTKLQGESDTASEYPFPLFLFSLFKEDGQNATGPPPSPLPETYLFCYSLHSKSKVEYVHWLMTLGSEMTRWHLGNVNCKQLLLGISHDNGYAPFLDNILLNDQMRERVTIIEGVPTAQEILATNVEILDLEMELFRKDKLVARVANHDPRKTSHEQIPVFTSPSPSNSSIVTPSTHSGSYAFAANSISGAAPAPKISTPLSKQFTAPTRSKTGGRKGAGNWSPGPRGFDIQVKVSAAALNAMKNRKGDNKLCNNFFARQECNKGSECPFVHNYTASSDEIDAIKQLSRMNPCVNGQYCEDTKCIYGHHVSYTYAAVRRCPTIAAAWLARLYAPPRS